MTTKFHFRMKPYSKKRQVLQRAYTSTLREIKEEREMICEGCGCNNDISPSHRIARSRNIEFLAVKENVDLYCSTCSMNYETSKFWLLQNGEEVKAWLFENDWELWKKKTDKETTLRLFGSFLSKNIRNLTTKLQELGLPIETLEEYEKAGLVKRLENLAELHYERLI